MASADNVHETQKLIEAQLAKRMAEFESQLTAAKGARPSIKLEALSKEFLEFKVFVMDMMSLLRQQILDMQVAVDKLENRSRSDCLLLRGIPEANGEDISQVVVGVIQDKLGIQDISKQSMRTCYRFGVPIESRARAVLVRFSDFGLRQKVWRCKTKFKGTPFSCAEFLTISRQSLFTDARKLVGIKNCWTQDGIVVVKLTDGTRRKIVHYSELADLVQNKLVSPTEEVQGEQQHLAKERSRRAARR